MTDDDDRWDEVTSWATLRAYIRANPDRVRRARVILVWFIATAVVVGAVTCWLALFLAGYWCC